MKQTKLKLVPRIILLVILTTLFINTYNILGYSSNWYELAGWLLELLIGIGIYQLIKPFNDKLESWIRSW